MNATVASRPAVPRTIPALLRAGGGPSRALLAPGCSPLSYHALRAEVGRLARDMRAAGIGPHDRVAIVLPNGPEMAIAFLAVTSCAVAAPLNPAYRAPEFAFYLNDLQAKAIITLRGQGSAAISSIQPGTVHLVLDGDRKSVV